MRRLTPSDVDAMIRRVDEAEVDGMWRFVGKKQEPRWLWHANDHWTGTVLVDVFGRRPDEVFLRLKARLEPLGIRRFHPDDWGTYKRHLGREVHHPGNRDTQQIERKHLPVRTRIKRPARQTICVSQSTEMPDMVIGLFVNHDAFGRPLCHHENPDLKHDHLVIVYDEQRAMPVLHGIGVFLTRVEEWR